MPAITLKIPRHLSGEREVTSIEAFDLFDARASVFGEVEDIDLPVAENDPHTDRRMTKRIDRVLGIRERIVLDAGFLEGDVELTLDDTGGCLSVLVMRQEQIILASSVGVAFPDPLVDGDSAFH